MFARSEDLEPLLMDMREAERRGVEISIISTGAVPRVGNTFSHHLTSPDVILERMGCRLMVLATDSPRSTSATTSGSRS